MNYYFLVLDSKNRIVFKKKLENPDVSSELQGEFKKLDYTAHLLQGKSFANALAEKNLHPSEDKAFYIKKNLKEEFHLTDRKIKEFLGAPDRIEKVKGSRDQFMHLYSKTRVESALASPEFRAAAEPKPARNQSGSGPISADPTAPRPRNSAPISADPTAPRQLNPEASGADSAASRRNNKRNKSRPTKQARNEPPLLKSGPKSLANDRGRGRNRVPLSSSPLGVIIKNAPRSGNSLENLAKEKLNELVRKLRKDWDLNEYRDFFQTAREMKRKHVFFVGPTNSGKSYRGFNELVAGNSGVYLAPLRLLALEGQEEVEKRGRSCSLLTGEEIDIREGANFIASTVEMTNLDRPIDCALIDEVQMVLDPNRGWAWSQAIVGIPAKKIIMTGSDECIPTLKRLIEEYLGEELEIVHLERIGKLEVIDRPVKQMSKADVGTAIIAFSRRGVLALKKDLEDAGRRVSVLYGNLSPGVRREEAKRFRSGETDLLVATDVIGMGLNLPIKTVIFSETTKFDGKEMRPLNVQEVKQIAGRAGRYGKFECGYVGVANGENIGNVIRNLNMKVEASLESCFVRPTLTQLEVLRDQMGGGTIRGTISLFGQLSQANSVIVCSDLTEMLALAEKIEAVAALLAELSFSDRYLFTCAPVNANDLVVEKYIDWLISFAKKEPVTLQDDDYGNFTSGSTSEDRTLNQAENSVKLLTLYHWLARKKPEYFPSLEKAEELREQINSFIENSLKRRGLHKKCVECSRKIPLHQTHQICNDCFRKRRFARI